MKILLGVVSLFLVLGCARVIAEDNFDAGMGLVLEPKPSEHDLIVKVNESRKRVASGAKVTAARAPNAGQPLCQS